MTARHSTLENEIQRQIEAGLGAEPDFLLLRNSVGKASYLNEESGKEYHVPYGLGVGSPDLVGILRVEASRAPSQRNVSLDLYKSALGIWLCFEVKVPGEDAEPHQAHSHRIWRSFGALVYVVHSVVEARSALVEARALVRRFTEAA